MTPTQRTKDIWSIRKRARISDRNLLKPVLREEILSQYQTVFDAYKNAYETISGKKPDATTDALFCGMLLGGHQIDPYAGMRDEEASERNDTYKHIDHTTAAYMQQLLQLNFMSELAPGEQRKIARRIARTSTSFLQNVHSYLFWGQSEKYVPDSAIQGLDEVYKDQALYESGIQFRAAVGYEKGMRQMKRVADLAVEMLNEMKRLKDTNATEAEIAASAQMFTEREKQIGIGI